MQNIAVKSEPVDGSIRFTAWLNGVVVGEMTITVLPLVHDMTIGTSLTAYRVADALLTYASGYVKASGFKEALVLVQAHNDSMHRYVQKRAIPEEPARAYMMGVE